jgi:hypothetical protein
MTPAQIQACTIQPDVAKEAYTQVEKRLADLLETKKSFEQRASTLLTGFSALALALLGAGAAFFTNQSLIGHGPKYLPFAFFIAAIPMTWALWYMVRAQQPISAGVLGSTPDLWLRPGVIDAVGNVVPAVQAYVVYYMAERINTTERANSVREMLILDGCKLALAAPAVLTVAAILAMAFEPKSSTLAPWEFPI